jgi:hypothetical protein
MAQLDCGLVTTEGTGVKRAPVENGGSVREGFGFGAGQGGVGSGRRALKGPGIPPLRVLSSDLTSSPFSSPPTAVVALHFPVSLPTGEAGRS